MKKKRTDKKEKPAILRASIFILCNCVFLIIFSTLWIGVDSANSTKQNYYSIHLKSFKELKNANEFINSLKKSGNMVFWKKVHVPGKGEYYRVYMGKYKDREKAIEFWKTLKEEGSVSYFGIHDFTEEDQMFQAREPLDAVIPEEKNEDNNTIPVTTQERFVDNGDGTITDRKTNLMWIKNGWRIDFFSALKWQDAIKKCKDFKVGGYTNWRLPTISEWKSLLDKKNEFPALIEPNPFENVIVHMPYWSKTEYRYNQRVPVERSARVYTIMLYYGKIGHQSINKRAFVLPVRSIN